MISKSIAFSKDSRASIYPMDNFLITYSGPILGRGIKTRDNLIFMKNILVANKISHLVIKII
jgi:hypothetical protein